MHRPRFIRCSSPLAAALILELFFVAAVTAAEKKPPQPLPAFRLPFSGTAPKGFCTLGGTLSVFDLPNRVLYVANKDGLLQPVEDMKGWAVSDATNLGGKPVYCSRDRLLQKIAGKVDVRTIPGNSNLISIAADGRSVRVLDASASPAVLTLDPRSGKVLSRLPYDGVRPVDIAVNGNSLFVLDLGDRCVHHLDPRTGRTSLKIQVGPGVCGGSGGIVFLGNQLHVHEADFQRLRPLPWRAERSAVSSWAASLKMTFVQESDNHSASGTTTVDFRVPVPADGYSQTVGPLRWSHEPDESIHDRFGQQVAKFRNIQIKPKGHHDLSYSTTVRTQAVQFDPPDLPLSSLDKIPAEIRQTYLAADPVYRLDAPEILDAATQARRDSKGREPSGVRSLIANIAWYQSRRLSYVMDDTWDDSLEVLKRGTGSCSEYSFLFSSLCRLNKIPTRLVGGIQIANYGERHEATAFHRWTEVYFPELGWIPVDVTKFDDAADDSRDLEFLFGTPGYLIVLSRGGVDEEVLGKGYYIHRSYRGGQRTRRTYVVVEPDPATPPVEKTLRLR